MAKVMLMNAEPGKVAEPSLALEALYEIYKEAGRDGDCEGLERG